MLWGYGWGFGDFGVFGYFRLLGRKIKKLKCFGTKYFWVFGYFRVLDRLVLIGMGVWLGIRVFWGIWLFPVIGKKNKKIKVFLDKVFLGIWVFQGIGKAGIDLYWGMAGDLGILGYLVISGYWEEK